MADTYVQVTNTGQTVFSLPFSSNYLLKSHVKVYKGRDLLAETQTSTLSDGTDYTFTSATQITLTTGLASGEELTIQRQTPKDSQLSPWSDGSNLTSEALNNADLQNLYIVQEQADLNALGATKSIAATTAANTATSTANSATTTANAATTTANSATTTANSAVTTANAAETKADAAVTTANAADTKADTAVTTANTASTNASNAVTTANAASSTANTASTNASNAVTTANSATTTANTANTTANTALNNSRESDGSGGYTTAISKANTAVTTANTASTNASNAVTTANSATTTANAATTTANNASATATSAQNAVSAAVLYSPVTNVSSIPGSPSDGDYIEVADSTGIESFSPLASLPSGFTGDAGLTVRLKYTTSGTTWNYLSYFANDSEDRYSGVYGKHVPTQETYVVKVVAKTAAHKEQGNGSTDGYTIGGIQSPHLELIPGNTYRFDQADSSNSGHPIAFYKKRDKSGGVYTTGVTSSGTPGSSGAYTQITISDDTPGYLHYQCQSHAYMGGSINANTASGGGAINDWLYENAQTVSESYTITSNKNAMAVGPVAIGSSVTITIPNNSVLLIH